MGSLLEHIVDFARSLLPGEDAIALNRRQASELEEARNALEAASMATEHVLLAEDLRRARAALDRLTGRASVEDLLDTLFGRFCLGK
jgi:tRNA modification GTPase